MEDPNVTRLGDVIGKMTEHAAGLFIWADMVVKYVGRPTVGDPVQRLRNVLEDIKTSFGIDGCDSVDRLYARIIFEAFRRSDIGERNEAKRGSRRCLAC